MSGKIPVETACRNDFPFVTLPGVSASAVFYLEDAAEGPLQNTVPVALLLTLEYLAGITANTRIEVYHSMGPWEAHNGASRG